MANSRQTGELALRERQPTVRSPVRVRMCSRTCRIGSPHLSWAIHLSLDPVQSNEW